MKSNYSRLFVFLILMVVCFFSRPSRGNSSYASLSVLAQIRGIDISAAVDAYALSDDPIYGFRKNQNDQMNHRRLIHSGDNLIIHKSIGSDYA